MKNPFSPGHQCTYWKEVTERDIATFPSGTVHPVYATFSIARDAEWSTRLFVLEMKEEDEEGIGTSIEITHHAPALVGSTIEYRAYLIEVRGHEVLCRFEAWCSGRLIASGKTGQKILKKEKVARLLQSLQPSP